MAVFTVSPIRGYVTDTFAVDASWSSDLEDSVSALQVRWDWEDDGIWDTNWSTSKTAQHQYPTPGNYTIRLEVMDTGGLTSWMKRDVEVVPGKGFVESTNLGPVFAILALPPLVSLAVVLLLAHWRRLRRPKMSERGPDSSGVDRDTPSRVRDHVERSEHLIPPELEGRKFLVVASVAIALATALPSVMCLRVVHEYETVGFDVNTSIEMPRRVSHVGSWSEKVPLKISVQVLEGFINYLRVEFQMDDKYGTIWSTYCDEVIVSCRVKWPQHFGYAEMVGNRLGTGENISFTFDFFWASIDEENLLGFHTVSLKLSYGISSKSFPWAVNRIREENRTEWVLVV